MPRTEVFAGPHVEAAGLRILRHHHGNCDAQGRGERDGRRDPQQHRTGSSARGDGNPARAHHAGDGEQRYIEQPELATQRSFGLAHLSKPLSIQMSASLVATALTTLLPSGDTLRRTLPV